MRLEGEPPVYYHDKTVFESWADVYVNPVNCVGVAGAGLAKRFAEEMPSLMRRYKELCARGELEIGRPRLLETGVLTPSHVALVPTKHHYKERSVLESVRASVRGLVRELDGVAGARTVAMPKIGCGLGGLDWRDVHPLVVEEFAGSSVTLVFCLKEK